ncbi:MAG TPA: cysteine desulfurase-like protein [Gemmatimonadaceae bacterium]|nr:cysteine desulfurase-like protein [Gemmatimonadaceae bacterium]
MTHGIRVPRHGGAVAGVEAIRAHFPALERREHGLPVAYFDGPGGTQVPRQVVNAMADYLYHHNANTHWEYPTSAETDALILRARATLADFLNAAPDEIAFGANMTSLTFHLARGLGRAWGPGDEIVVTELDHHADIAPWQALATERGVGMRMVRMNPADGRLDWRDLERQIGPRTRLLAIGAASNALGTISDIRSATALAHAAGALAFVDAVHYAPHALVDVQEIDCDFLACSAYKFYGPHIGVLFGRRALIEATDLPRLAPAPQEAPERLETGTQNHEGMLGAAAAVDFLAGLGGLEGAATTSSAARRAALEHTFQELHRRGEVLVARLWSGLAAIGGVTLYGPAPGSPRTPTVAFRVRGHSSDEVAHALAARGVFVSHGDFYAATIIERLGLPPDGLVRAGCSCYTTGQEVDRLVEGVRLLAS